MMEIMEFTVIRTICAISALCRHLLNQMHTFRMWIASDDGHCVHCTSFKLSCTAMLNVNDNQNYDSQLLFNSLHQITCEK